MPGNASAARFRVATLILAFAAWACAHQTRREVTSLPSPAGPGSGEPSLTLGGDGKLYLSWLEPEAEGHVFKFSAWEGKAWSPARAIARGRDWVVNWADVPRLTVLGDGKTIMAHWLVQTGQGEAYDIRIARSLDGGDSWSAPMTPYQDTTRTEHGFVSWHSVSPDRAALIWLDGRETARGGPTMLRYATLSANGTLAEEGIVDPRVCDCCPTDLAGEGNALVAVYRDRSEEEIRDIRVARYDGNAWIAGSPVHADGWKIAGCPVNGPAVAMRGNALAVAWFTADSTDHAHVRLAMSRDAGATFLAPIEVAASQPLGRVGVALTPDGTAWVLWMESGKDGSAEVRLRHFDGAGTPEESIRVARVGASRGSGVPRLAAVGDALFVAWTATGGDHDPGAPDRVLTARIR